MPKDSLSSVVQYLHRIVGAAGPSEVSDAELLDRFASLRDESAFGLLVYRHGPLVLGLCHRLLHHEQDAEDAFQATFLTLARKAGSIGKKEALASWLYKVAYRIACRLRAKIPLLTNQTVSLDDKPVFPIETDAVWRDLRGVLDREIAALPEAHGRAVILCYFEGKSHEEAARLLGCPKGTLTVRLTRARERLRQRLTRRGLTLSAGALATVLAEKAFAGTISAEVVRTTANAALAFTSGKAAAAGLFSAHAAILAEGALQMMWFSKLKFAAVLLLAVVLTGSGVGWAMFTAVAGDGTEHVQAQPRSKPPNDPQTGDAVLRAEVAKLRRDLDAALKEIKSLKDAKQDAGPKQREPLYRGKPLSFYLEQMNDGDPGFRGEAVKVIGAFAQKDKALTPLLIAALKDEGYFVFGVGKDQSNTRVGDEALAALKELGPTGMPAVIDTLPKYNAFPEAQARLARYLGKFGPKAKAAVPALTEALKADLANPSAKDWVVRPALIEALGLIGPDAKSAIPVIAEAFEPAMLSLERIAKERKEPVFDYLRGYSLPAVIVVALKRIDPEINVLLPSPSELGFSLTTYGDVNPNRRSQAEIAASWRKARKVLQKKFGTEKQAQP